MLSFLRETPGRGAVTGQQVHPARRRPERFSPPQFDGEDTLGGGPSGEPLQKGPRPMGSTTTGLFSTTIPTTPNGFLRCRFPYSVRPLPVAGNTLE